MDVVFFCSEGIVWDFCEEGEVGDHRVVDQFEIVLLCECEV